MRKYISVSRLQDLSVSLFPRAAVRIFVEFARIVALLASPLFLNPKLDEHVQPALTREWMKHISRVV